MNMMDILFAQQTSEGGGGSEGGSGQKFEPLIINNKIFTQNSLNASIVPGPIVDKVINEWDLTSSLVDSIGGEIATLGGDATMTSDGVSITGYYQYISFPSSLFQSGRAFEAHIKSMTCKTGSTHGRFFMWTETDGFILRSGNAWNIYTGSWGGTSYGDVYDKEAFNNALLRVEYRTQGSQKTISVFKNSSLFFETTTTANINPSSLMIGASSQSYFDLVIDSFKVIKLAPI